MEYSIYDYNKNDVIKIIKFYSAYLLKEYGIIFT